VREIQFWNLLNLGFTTTITIDNVSLFNTQHPLLGGSQATAIGPGVSNIIAAAGTYPNRPTTDVDLSFTAVQLAINMFERLIDSQGLPISMRPKYLVIPPELKWIAREVLGSPHKPYTADNEINSLIKEDLMYFVSHYLTSASAWFLVGEKESHTLKFMNREPLEDDFSDDFDTRTVKQIAFMRFSVGATNWLGTWGLTTTFEAPSAATQCKKAGELRGTLTKSILSQAAFYAEGATTIPQGSRGQVTAEAPATRWDN
jgi:hypothetical protein